MPIKERDTLPRLNNDKPIKELVKTADVIMRVISLGDSNLIAINRLQYTGSTLISLKIAPRKLPANR